MDAEISEIDAELVFDRMSELVLEDSGETARAHLAAGCPVYYGTDTPPFRAGSGCPA
jgi:hypothetical protein